MRKNKYKKEEKTDFVITFTTSFGGSLGDNYLLYSLTADTTCFGKNNKITQGNIIFLNMSVFPLFYSIKKLIDQKALEGKFYTPGEYYDFYLSSKWSHERTGIEVKKRLDSLPYNTGGVFGPYPVKWEEDYSKSLINKLITKIVDKH